MMLKQLSELELESRKLELSPAQKKEADSVVFGFADEFTKTIPQQKLYEKEGYDPDNFDAKIALAEEGEDVASIMHSIDEQSIKPGLNPTSGAYLAYIPGGGLYASALGDYLAAVTNRFAGLFFASPGSVRIENTLVRWTGKVLGYTGSFGGYLSSGGSIANLTAMSTARWAKKIKGKDYEKTVIYLSEQSHHSVEKAIRLSGLNECILRYLHLDNAFRIIPSAFEKMVEEDIAKGLSPFLTVANAGSTNVGAVDPMDAMADICEKHGLWFHVDAAYGGYFALTDYGKKLFKGINRADSITIDPHKGLFLPYGTGIALVKDVKALREANQYQAPYLQDTDGFDMEYSPSEVSPELSKHYRGLRMYMALKLHGISVFRSALDEKLLLARYFYKKVEALGFEVGPEPELSVSIYRYHPKNGKEVDAFNKELTLAVQHEGKVYVSSTSLSGAYWLRCAALSFRTHKEHIDLLLNQLEKHVILLDK
jgi:glutamate/tyrosine decarboxylase-like PLP-dependent enzyme